MKSHHGVQLCTVYIKLNPYFKYFKFRTHLFVESKWRFDKSIMFPEPVLENKPFVCNDCGRSYSRKPNLNKHQRYECGKEPQFMCPVCPYRAKHKTTLHTHLGLQHKEYWTMHFQLINKQLWYCCASCRMWIVQRTCLCLFMTNRSAQLYLYEHKFICYK